MLFVGLSILSGSMPEPGMGVVKRQPFNYSARRVRAAGESFDVESELGDCMAGVPRTGVLHEYAIGVCCDEHFTNRCAQLEDAVAGCPTLESHFRGTRNCPTGHMFDFFVRCFGFCEEGSRRWCGAILAHERCVATALAESAAASALGIGAVAASPSSWLPGGRHLLDSKRESV
jgi:hypothetical protein